MEDINVLKAKVELLERENEFLRKLIERLSPPVSDPDTFKVPGTPYVPYPWETPYGPVTWPKVDKYTMTSGCAVCGITGVNGLVCYNPNCPSRCYSTTNGE